MIWLSPAFPVGSFAYSHALEWAAEAGDLPSAEALQVLARGPDRPRRDAQRRDPALRGLARRARCRSRRALRTVNDLALALAGSRERHLETSAQGDAFRIAIRAAWRNAGIRPVGRLRLEGAIAYPVAVGPAAGAHHLDLAPLSMPS